jgi:hypothetical protein
MKSIAPSLLIAASTFTSATHVQLYPRYINSTSSAITNSTLSIPSNSTIPSNATFVPPPCFTITEMRKVIPSCALSCQTLALKADNCAYEDTACHCANTAAISAVVEPCLAASNCSSVDVTAFAAIVMPTCAFFNATTNGTMPASCKLPIDDDTPPSNDEPEEEGGDYGYPAAPAPSPPPPPPPPPSTTATVPSKPAVTGYGYPAPPSPPSNTTTTPSKPVVTGYGYPAPPSPPSNTTTTPSKPVVTGYGYPAPPPPPSSNATIPSKSSITGYGYAAPTGYGYPPAHKSTGMAIVPTKSSIGAPSSSPVPYTAGASVAGRSTGLVVLFGIVAVMALL